MLRECAASDCTTVFQLERHPNGGWTRKKYCSAKCQGRARYERQAYREAERKRQCSQRRRDYQQAWRDAHKDWGAWWQQQRYYEDKRELRKRKPKPKLGPHCQLNDAPTIRHFVGWYCTSCGDPFIYYSKRAQSSYCAECNQAHHRRPASRRAKQNGAHYEVIVPRRVFERDNWRCQICKRKLKGDFPSPRSPTIDHILPLAKGGDHTYVNVQAACFECNCLKQDGSANDQLRLLA